MKDTGYCRQFSLNLKGNLRIFNSPLVMGILNMTSDSFYDGGKNLNSADLDVTIQKMINDGADIIDVGGYSSRPGAKEISIEEELNRVLPAIKLIRNNHPEILISLDTFRSQVARAGLDNGVDIINDISGGLLDAKMHSTVAEFEVPYVLMHMRGNPQNMTDKSVYKNVTTEVIKELSGQIEAAKLAGIKDLIIDPGFGFSKNLDQNYELFKRLNLLTALDRPVLVGISRKSMIYKKLNTTAENALNGTTALNVLALERGANILRVHDVKEAKELITLWSSASNH